MKNINDMKDIDFQITKTKRVLIRNSKTHVTIYYQELDTRHNDIREIDRMSIEK